MIHDSVSVKYSFRGPNQNCVFRWCDLLKGDITQSFYATVFE